MVGAPGTWEAGAGSLNYLEFHMVSVSNQIHWGASGMAQSTGERAPWTGEEAQHLRALLFSQVAGSHSSRSMSVIAVPGDLIPSSGLSH